MAAAAPGLGSGSLANGQVTTQLQEMRLQCDHYFQMPVHYPRYTKADYETMPEWKLDCLLREYGLPVAGDVQHKRKFAMGSFLWLN